MIKKIFKKKSKEDIIFDIFVYIFILFCAFITLLPLMHVFSKAVSSESAIISGKVGIVPVGFQLSTMKFVVSSKQFLRSFGISVFVTLIGTVLSIILTAITAYPLSKKHIKGVKPILILYVFTMLFNGGLIPNYILIRNLGLINKLSSLILPMLINVFNLLVIKSYYETIPESLEESAKIDGASYTRILFKIILPLSKSVLATISLFYAVYYWNDYFRPMLYISDASLKPLQVYLQEVVMEIGDSALGFEGSIDDMMDITPEGIRAAVIVASTVPILIVYPFMQKYFIKGILIGSVKG